MNNEVPIWFGPADRPLFGWFHSTADRMARAGVLLCPPVGHEYHESYSTLRLLAEKLADLGTCVLRMDYDGVGDSAGDYLDPGRAAAWLGSVLEGVAVLRRAGARSVVMVGMRTGALLAGLAAGRDGAVDGLVLWDPVLSGRAYLAEQRALNAFAVGTGTDAGTNRLVQLPGMVLTADAAAELRQLDLVKSAGALAAQVLVLTRPERGAGSLAERLAGTAVEWGDATGQSELMELGSAYGVIAYQAVDQVAAWVARVSPGTMAPLTAPAPAGQARVAGGPDGGGPDGGGPDGPTVRETPMALGPSGLFGILTEGARREGSPTVVFLNVANGNRTGPDRLWVELARSWAAHGLRCFRFDLSGLGDSPTRHDGQARYVSRAPESFDDITEVCAALEPADPSNVVLVGSCTTGYQVLESALEVSPRGVVAINPETSFRLPEKAVTGRADPRRRIALPRRAPLAAYYKAQHEEEGSASGHRGPNILGALRAMAAPRSKAGQWLRDHERAIVTNLMWRLRMVNAPERRPARWLSELVSRHIDVFIVCSKNDARSLLLGVRKSLLEQLQHDGLRLVRISDHGFRVLEERLAVTSALTEHVLERFAPPFISAPARPELHERPVPGISAPQIAS